MHGRSSPSSIRRRRKRIASWLVLAVFLVAAAVARSTYLRHTAPERVRALAEAALARHTHGTVRVGSASFSWFRGIRLYDVTVSAAATKGDATDAGPSGASPAVFSCREIELEHDRWRMLRGQLGVRSIVAHEPICTISRRNSDGATNLAGLFKTPSGEGTLELGTLPALELRDARVRVMARDRGKQRVVEDLTVSVRGLSQGGSARFYDLVWRGDRDRRAGGGRAGGGRARLDVSTGRLRNISGGLPWISLEAVLIAVNSAYDEAGRWSDLLGLLGRVRVQDYDLNLAGPPGETTAAVIELRETSLSIPMSREEQPLARFERYLRFDNADGVIHVTAEGLAADFTASFHDSPCRVVASMSGRLEEMATLDDVDLSVQINMDHLALPRLDTGAPPEEARFIRRWPALARFYRDYDPHGRLDIELTASKTAGVDSPLALERLLLTSRGTDASWRRYPYRVHDLKGTVEVTPAGVAIRRIRGVHDGGTVELSGTLAGLRPGGAAAITVTARGLTVNDELYRAVPEAFRRAMVQFDPQGLLDLDMAMRRPQRPPGGKDKWESCLLISFDDLSVCYDRFPYPLEHASGAVVVDGPHVQLADVRAVASDGELRLDGSVEFDNRKLASLEIIIDGTNLAADGALFAALPGNIGDDLQRFHPQGRFDITTRLARDARQGTLTHETVVDLQGITLRHEEFPVRIQDVKGRINLSPGTIEMQGLVGSRGSATLSAAGVIRFSGDRPAFDVVVMGDDLAIDDASRAAAPPWLGNALGDWNVTGPIDFETVIHSDIHADDHARKQGPHVRTTAQLSGATIAHPMFPVPFEGIRGKVVLDGSSVRTSGLTATYGGAKINVDFDTHRSALGEQGNIRIEARGVELDSTIRDILPDKYRTAWNTRNPGGLVDVFLDPLSYRRAAGAEASEWEVAGHVDLHDVGLHGLARLESLRGKMTVNGFFVDRLGGVQLSGELDATSVTLFGHHLTGVHTPWTFAQVRSGEGVFTLDNVNAEVASGLVVGRLRLDFGARQQDGRSPTRYELSAKALDVGLASVMGAPQRARPAGVDAPALTRHEQDADVQGRVTANLKLRGVFGEPGGKTGHGRVALQDANLYRLPLMLSVLNVANLSIPGRNAADNATADFVVVGNRLDLQHIDMQGETARLVGHGSVSIPDQGLNLSLISVSPYASMKSGGLSEFMRGVSRELLELHVTGPLSAPIVTARPLRSLTEEMQTLIKRKPPKRMRSLSSADQ